LSIWRRSAKSLLPDHNHGFLAPGFGRAPFCQRVSERCASMEGVSAASLAAERRDDYRVVRAAKDSKVA